MKAELGGLEFECGLEIIYCRKPRDSWPQQLSPSSQVNFFLKNSTETKTNHEMCALWPRKEIKTKTLQFLGLLLLGPLCPRPASFWTHVHYSIGEMNGPALQNYPHEHASSQLRKTSSRLSSSPRWLRVNYLHNKSSKSVHENRNLKSYGTNKGKHKTNLVTNGVGSAGVERTPTIKPK